MEDTVSVFEVNSVGADMERKLEELEAAVKQVEGEMTKSAEGKAEYEALQTALKEAVEKGNDDLDEVQSGAYTEDESALDKMKQDIEGKRVLTTT